MLTAMEIPVTAGPWLVLGVVLGVLLPATAGLAVVLLRTRRSPAPPPGPAAPDHGVDDLPGFLESPPGSAPAPAAPPPEWPALAAPPPRPAPQPGPDRRDGGTRAALVAMAVTALVLVGTAAAVATSRTSDGAGDPDGARDQVAPGPAARPDDVAADLTFGGVVLERHAVGVTVAYPRVTVTVRNGRPAAEVELPTFNCLTDAAPDDPVAAGCARSVPEYAELAGPALSARTEDDRLRVSGAFPTSHRPNGAPPVATGRVYELAVDVAPRDGTADGGTEPATGTLRLGEERVSTGDDGPNELTYGG
jgi:hypothetical protein